MKNLDENKRELKEVIKEIAGHLRWEFILQLLGLVLILSLVGYIAFKGNINFVVDDHEQIAEQEFEDLDLWRLSKQAIYMHIITKYDLNGCYTLRNGGREFEPCQCTGKIHPRYNTPIYKTTFEIAYIMEMNNSRRSFLPDGDLPLFTLDGYPLVFYAEIDGAYECFTSPGYHPELGIELIPVNPEKAKEWKTLIDNNEFHRFILENPEKEKKLRNPLSRDYYDRI